MFSFFFFNDTATTEIYTLSLHDALPISVSPRGQPRRHHGAAYHDDERRGDPQPRSEEHTSELQSLAYLVCRLLLEKKKKTKQKKNSGNAISVMTATQQSQLAAHHERVRH